MGAATSGGRLAGVLDAAACVRALGAFDAALSRARAGDVPAEDWSPVSSSLRWRAVRGLDAPALTAIERRVHDSTGAADAGWVLDLHLAWWRRQYPPRLAPERHHPHGWHQDGALGFDFAARPEGAADALRPIVTCWIALTPCGDDAPGLELLEAPVAGVLGLAPLADAALRRAYAPSAFRRPVLAPGDALLFAGAVPHRTHVTPAMTRVRSSLELRFVRPPACAPRSAS